MHWIFAYLILVPSLFAQQTTEDKCSYMLQAGAAYCPDISELNYSAFTNYWTAEGGWRSAEKSFSNKMAIFVGAQWRGQNVGRIACIYRSSNKGEFPIQLSRDTLVLSPSAIKDQSGTLDPNTPIWAPDARRKATFNCAPATGSVCDCPFFLMEQPKLPLNEEIRSIHKRSTEDAWIYI